MCVRVFAHMGTVCAAMYMQINCDCVSQCVFNVLMACAAYPSVAWTHWVTPQMAWCPREAGGRAPAAKQDEHTHTYYTHAHSSGRLSQGLNHINLTNLLPFIPKQEHLHNFITLCHHLTDTLLPIHYLPIHYFSEHVHIFWLFSQSVSRWAGINRLNNTWYTGIFRSVNMSLSCATEIHQQIYLVA